MTDDSLFLGSALAVASWRTLTSDRARTSIHMWISLLLPFCTSAMLDWSRVTLLNMLSTLRLFYCSLEYCWFSTDTFKRCRRQLANAKLFPCILWELWEEDSPQWYHGIVLHYVHDVSLIIYKLASRDWKQSHDNAIDKEKTPSIRIEEMYK